MAFFEDESAPELQPNPISNPIPYKGTFTESQYGDRHDIITGNIPGSPWRIPWYYSQALNLDNQTAGQEINRPAALQSYTRISDVVLYVTSYLDPQQDSDSPEMIGRGEANLFAGFIPNKSDQFVADIGGGHSAILAITDVRKSTWHKNTVYRIQYEIRGYATQALLRDLEVKTINRLTYVKDFASVGRSPLLYDEEFKRYTRIKAWLKRLPEYYYQRFFSNEYRTFLVPDQENTVYDPHILVAIQNMISPSDYARFSNINVLNVDSADVREATTLWDALMDGDEYAMRYVPKQYGKYDVTIKYQYPRYNSIRYSGIKEVYYPKDQELEYGVAVDAVGLNPSKATGGIIPTNPADINTLLNIPGLLIAGEVVAPPVIIYPVTESPHYVFSEYFYNRDHARMSAVEHMVVCMLNNQVIPLDYLFAIIDNSHAWGNVEQFYYYPLFVILLTYATEGVN